MQNIQNKPITANTYRNSSFRDPSGFIFSHKGRVCRQINLVYAENYDHLMNSGLYASLVAKGLLIPHDENYSIKANPDCWYKTIIPQRIPFISYPYEWCFGQLKDAALLMLDIQKTALEYGMSLKDCSAYNVQFNKGKPVLIDTLSFEKYTEGYPWFAYLQFCQHFLAPLSLMKYKDMRLNKMQRLFIDGIPLDLASKLLPAHTYFNAALLFHVHLHARSQKYYSHRTSHAKIKQFSKFSFLALINSLQDGVEGLNVGKIMSEWEDYYDNTNYTRESLEHKKQMIEAFLSEVDPHSIWDFGANSGEFSRLIKEGSNAYTISFDIDFGAIEKGYQENKRKGRDDILPLILNINNPSPSIGWSNQERLSLVERGPADLLMVLALIHHLVIGNNVSFLMMAEYFHRLCGSLIIEFVPKNDSQVMFLLRSREDIFQDYTLENFEKSFLQYFKILRKTKIKESERFLYLMQTKHDTI